MAQERKEFMRKEHMKALLMGVGAAGIAGLSARLRRGKGAHLPNEQKDADERKTSEDDCLRGYSCHCHPVAVAVLPVTSEDLSKKKRAIAKTVLEMIHMSGIDGEFDESVTDTDILAFLKESGILKQLKKLCKKNGIAPDDAEALLTAYWEILQDQLDAREKLSLCLDYFSEKYFESKV